GDDDDAAALVLAEERPEVPRRVPQLDRDGAGKDVRRAVQRVAGGDVRLRDELEDEDRAGDRDVAGHPERPAGGFGADIATGSGGARRRRPAAEGRDAGGPLGPS